MGTYDTRGGSPRHDPSFDIDLPCVICGNDPFYCTCPECPVCGAHGDPNCYENHGLTRKEKRMKFTLNFNMDNESFADDMRFQVDTILREISENVFDERTYGVVKDLYGNIIGRWDIEEGE